jgi:hypothetical protein
MLAMHKICMPRDAIGKSNDWRRQRLAAPETYEMKSILICIKVTPCRANEEFLVAAAAVHRLPLSRLARQAIQVNENSFPLKVRFGMRC